MNEGKCEPLQSCCHWISFTTYCDMWGISIAGKEARELQEFVSRNTCGHDLKFKFVSHGWLLAGWLGVPGEIWSWWPSQFLKLSKLGPSFAKGNGLRV